MKIICTILQHIYYWKEIRQHKRERSLSWRNQHWKVTGAIIDNTIKEYEADEKAELEVAALQEKDNIIKVLRKVFYYNLNFRIDESHIARHQHIITSATLISERYLC